MEKIKQKLWENKELLVAILLVLTLIITGSYAWARLQIKNNTVHIIKAGSLSLILDESASEGISLTNAMPTSDMKGLEKEPYIFTLENKSEKDLDYTIYLEDLPVDTGKDRMLDKDVKYSLTKNGGEATTAVLDTLDNRILDFGTINGKTSNTYTLKMWINKDADENVLATIFNAGLRIEASLPNTNS